jgi:hypothetical protein
MTTNRPPGVTMLLRLLTLLVCATVGGAAVLVCITSYYSASMIGQSLSELPWRLDGSGIVVSLLSLGVGTGIVGLGYVHVLASYALVLRKLPDFWSSLVKYFLFLFVGTVATSICYMELRGPKVPLTETLFIAPPWGYWGTVVYLWRKYQRGTRA